MSETVQIFRLRTVKGGGMTVWAVCNLRPWLVRRRVPGSTTVWIEGAK